MARLAWTKRILPHLAAYGLYFAVAIFLTWPLAAQLSTHLAGFEYGDSREMARHIWWYQEALRTGQPVFFQPLLGYPDGIEGGVLLWANPQQFFPAWLLALVLPLPAAANLAILFYMALNGWAAFFLARDLLDGETVPALLAGLVYMAAPTFQAHMAGGHAGLLVAWAAPLYIWALLHLIKRRSWRWFGLAVLFFILIPGGHILQVIYVTMPITALFLLWRLTARDWRGLGWVLAVNAVGGLLLGLYLLPIAASIFGTSAYTEEGGFVRYSIDLLSVVSPSFFHPLYQVLDYPRQVLGTNLEEGSSYLGLIAGLLALTGMLRSRAARPWLALALMAWVLALGPLLKGLDQPLTVSANNYVTPLALPYALLQNLPGFGLARTPGRFNFALALAVALLAGYGAREIAKVIHKPALRRSLLIGAAFLIVLDYRFFWPFPTYPAELPQAIHALAEREDIRAVFDIPWENTVAAKEALYLQTAHYKPLIAGHVTRSTPVDPAKLTVMQATLDPVLLNAAGADVVIVHKNYVDTLDDIRAQLGDALYEGADYALFEVPKPARMADPPIWTASDGIGYFRTFAINTVEGDPLLIDNRHNLYLYAPLDGWTLLRTTLSGTNRSFELQLDGEAFGRWSLDGELALEIPLPVSQGYHTITLIADPACPEHVPEGLRCQSVTVSELTISSVEAAGSSGIQFANGITLDYAMPPSGFEVNSISLYWQFEQPPPEDSIRFLKILDADGNPVEEIDSPLDTGGA
ncbi:MAG: hypothetical protein K8L99_13340, partial [Anaerolineae bacterium]|nr:hypothetical protein [Anaerolineae bacterium]